MTECPGAKASVCPSQSQPPFGGQRILGATEPAVFSDLASGTTPLLVKGTLWPLDDLIGQHH